jgi:plastocyanin
VHVGELGTRGSVRVWHQSAVPATCADARRVGTPGIVVASRSRLRVKAFSKFGRTLVGVALASLQACSLGQAPTGETSASPAVTVHVVALGLAFEPATLVLPSGTPVGITFENRDPGILHNIAIMTADGTVVFRGETFAGIEARTYRVAALSAREFRFICDVHPTMTGTLIVDAEP